MTLASWPLLYILRSVCTALRMWVETYIQKRRLRQQNYALFHYYTFAADVERYGEPFRYWPSPSWRMWKVEVWWYFDGLHRYDRGWICERTYWMNSLAQLSDIHRNMYRTAGMYNHFQLTLSSWIWDYTYQVWQEEDHTYLYNHLQL